MFILHTIDDVNPYFKLFMFHTNTKYAEFYTLNVVTFYGWFILACTAESIIMHLYYTITEWPYSTKENVILGTN